MRLLSIHELMRMTRIELCDLARWIETRLSEFPEGSDERANAFTNLRNIRHELLRRDLSCRP